MCAFGEFWWAFLLVGTLSGCVLPLLPSDAMKAGLVFGLMCLVALVIAGGANNGLQCKELKYQVVLDKRAGLVQECPNREKPSCQLKWIRYQKDSLDRYLRVLQ